MHEFAAGFRSGQTTSTGFFEALIRAIVPVAGTTIQDCAFATAANPYSRPCVLVLTRSPPCVVQIFSAEGYVRGVVRELNGPRILAPLPLQIISACRFRDLHKRPR